MSSVISGDDARTKARVAGLFAGIGGIELGLHQSKLKAETVLWCEIDDAAREVLLAQFGTDIDLRGDVREILPSGGLPEVDLVTAGFPCQDLSQAGRTAGIGGNRSGLVGEVFKLIDAMTEGPRWVLLENVPFMLQLDRGAAMTFLTSEFARRGFTWAYRVVDAQAFGLPQRRQRTIFLASRTEDPTRVLFASEAASPPRHDSVDYEHLACGFYWTEGLRGLGWAVDSIPTLKGGSTVGIPSPPAIVLPGADGIVLPEIENAERFQGFPPGWTQAADLGRRNGPRWKLVGNAVSVAVARWLGDQLADPGEWEDTARTALVKHKNWPTAAWGAGSDAYEVDRSPHPVDVKRPHLQEFLDHANTRPLSLRAAEGFLARYQRGTLRQKPYLVHALRRHVAQWVEAPEAKSA